jgi:hypothetical protein
VGLVAGLPLVFKLWPSLPKPQRHRDSLAESTYESNDKIQFRFPKESKVINLTNMLMVISDYKLANISTLILVWNQINKFKVFLVLGFISFTFHLPSDL